MKGIDDFYNHVFMIAQALVESGKHTNRYELAREAVLIAEAVSDEIARVADNAWLWWHEPRRSFS